MTPREQALVEAARELREAIRVAGIKRTPGIYGPVMHLSAALSQYEDKETDNG